MRLAACGSRLLVRLLVLPLVACGGGGDSDYPIKPGGGNGTGTAGSGANDAAVDATPTNMLDGSVCVLTDARAFDSCTASGLAGIVVRIGTYSATTDDTGAFSITKPSGTGLFWKLTSPASGVQIVNAIVPFGADTKLRVLGKDMYAVLVSTNAVTQPAGAAAIFVEITDGDAPIAGASVVSASTTQPVRYDDLAPSTWSTGDATMANGVAWLSNVNVVPSAAPLTITVGPDPYPYAIRVVSDYVTFAIFSTAAQ